MKFCTLEELLAAWRQAETDDDDQLFFVLWADGTDGGGLTALAEWKADKRLWFPMPLAQAVRAIWQHLASHDVKCMADIEQKLSQYELMWHEALRVRQNVGDV